MTDYPTLEDRGKAIKKKEIYCKRITGCNEVYCCWFCSERRKCNLTCRREYWNLCRNRIGWKEVTWTKVFGEDKNENSITQRNTHT